MPVRVPPPLPHSHPWNSATPRASGSPQLLQPPLLGLNREQKFSFLLPSSLGRVEPESDLLPPGPRGLLSPPSPAGSPAQAQFRSGGCGIAPRAWLPSRRSPGTLNPRPAKFPGRARSLGPPGRRIFSGWRGREDRVTRMEVTCGARRDGGLDSVTIAVQGPSTSADVGQPVCSLVPHSSSLLIYFSSLKKARLGCFETMLGWL